MRWLGAALHRRVAAIALAVMAATLAAAALLTAQLIRVDDATALDDVLLGELDEVRLTMPGLLEQAAAADGDPALTPAEAAAAGEGYLRTHAGGPRHLAVLQFSGWTGYTKASPADLRDLVFRDDLPASEPGRLVTAPSTVGELRVLDAPVTAQGQTVGTVRLIGSLEPGRERAAEALQRIALTGGAGLLVGGAVLVVAVRRATAPLRRLAQAASAVDLAALAQASDRPAEVPGRDRRDEVGAVAHEVDRMLARIRADEAARRRMLASVSHELRTPLAVAQGHLEVFELTGRHDPGETAAVLRRELDRLGRIVDDLTAVTRGATATGHEAELDAVFVPDLLTALAERVAGLGLPHVELQPAREAPPLVVVGDEDRVVQALLALVLNARTHTPVGTRVRVGARVAGAREGGGDGWVPPGWVVLEVDDDGPGVDPAVVDVVFEPFVTTRPSGDARGSGLGLSVVRSTTLAQGGRVDLRTGPTGTTVSLAFPPEE